MDKTAKNEVKDLTGSMMDAMIPGLVQGLHVSQESSAWDQYVCAALEAGQPAGTAVTTADMILAARRARFTAEMARSEAARGVPAPVVDLRRGDPALSSIAELEDPASPLSKLVASLGPVAPATNGEAP